MSLRADTEPSDVTLALPRGPRVNLRSVRARDLDAVRSLAERAGLVCDELELARLVRSDPTVRLVLCATARIDDVETVLGLGVIELAQGATMPSLLLVDAALTDGLQAVLHEALIARAHELAARRPG